MFSDFVIHSVGQAGGESGRQKDEFHVSVSLDIPASCKKIFFSSLVPDSSKIFLFSFMRMIFASLAKAREG